MYSQKIMEIFSDPENMGEIRTANAIGDAGSAGIGDILKFYMIVDGGQIMEAKCKAFGSAVAIAVGSVCAQKLVGKTLDEALELNINEVEETLGEIPDGKKHCLQLAKEAIAAAVNYYYKKQEKAEKEEVN